MTTAEAARQDAPHIAHEAPRQRSQVPPSAPSLSVQWLLRTAAYSAVAAGFLGVIVAPGAQGNASESVVVALGRAAAVLSYFLVALLVSLVLWGAVALARTRGVGVLPRIGLIGSGAAVVALSSPSLRDRLPPGLALLVAAAAAVAAISGAYTAARTPHTRAAAGLLFALAFAAMARLGAWELATAAGERASMHLFSVSRALATGGVLLEAIGQLVAMTWLGTRSRLAGQLASSVALLVAFLLTWGVARGAHSNAAFWQCMLHTALADAPGMPPPYGLEAMATFLVPASMLLALVAAAQPREVVAIVAAMALALVSRGAFDAPLRALCVVAASQWVALACADQRGMWSR
ncbi:MAG: hypothetical protein M3O50_05005 [Myxococcota bacterium]|nr:hypothetical protein [Myxococcota bacterium]